MPITTAPMPIAIPTVRPMLLSGYMLRGEVSSGNIMSWTHCNICFLNHNGCLVCIGMIKLGDSRQLYWIATNAVRAWPSPLLEERRYHTTRRMNYSHSCNHRKPSHDGDPNNGRRVQTLRQSPDRYQSDYDHPSLSVASTDKYRVEPWHIQRWIKFTSNRATLNILDRGTKLQYILPLRLAPLHPDSRCETAVAVAREEGRKELQMNGWHSSILSQIPPINERRYVNNKPTSMSSSIHNPCVQRIAAKSHEGMTNGRYSVIVA
jgi:hypothetical protein